jgi:hypothetical protein
MRRGSGQVHRANSLAGISGFLTGLRGSGDAGAHFPTFSEFNLWILRLLPATHSSCSFMPVSASNPHSSLANQVPPSHLKHGPKRIPAPPWPLCCRSCTERGSPVLDCDEYESHGLASAQDGEKPFISRMGRSASEACGTKVLSVARCLQHRCSLNYACQIII